VAGTDEYLTKAFLSDIGASSQGGANAVRAISQAIAGREQKTFCFFMDF
jgi:hypothetical protein